MSSRDPGPRPPASRLLLDILGALQGIPAMGSLAADMGQYFRPELGSERNPVPLAGIFAARPVPDWIADYAFSPLVRDTMASLLGATPKFRWTPKDSNWAAAWVGQEAPDVVNIAADFSGQRNVGDAVFRNIDQIAEHELGHSFDFLTREDDKERLQLLKDVWLDLMKQPASRAANQDLIWGSRWLGRGDEGAREHFADAFASAIGAVRLSQLKDVTRKEFLDSVDFWEEVRPGTARITDYILRQPIYAEHPYKDALRGRFKERR